MGYNKCVNLPNEMRQYQSLLLLPTERPPMIRRLHFLTFCLCVAVGTVPAVAQSWRNAGSKAAGLLRISWPRSHSHLYAPKATLRITAITCQLRKQ